MSDDDIIAEIVGTKLDAVTSDQAQRLRALLPDVLASVEGRLPRAVRRSRRERFARCRAVMALPWDESMGEGVVYLMWLVKLLGEHAPGDYSGTDAGAIGAAVHLLGDLGFYEVTQELLH
jgi:hypothetical protein